MRILAIERRVLTELTRAQFGEIQAAVAGRYEVMPFDEVDAQRADDIELAFGNIGMARAAELSNLKWVQLTSAGIDAFTRTMEPVRLPYTLTNATGAYGECISEHILGFMLGMARGLHRYRDYQHARVWRDAPHHARFAGSTVLVIGLGDIGRATARKCAALGANVLGVKRTPSEKPDYVQELYFDLDASLDAIIPRADYVALCLPGTSRTRHVLTRERLRAMKDTCVIVNIGRGALIDQQALIDEMRKGRLFAGLDVVTPEPLEPDSPLWTIENCWITPHMAGRSGHNMEKIHAIFMRNLALYLSGEPLTEMVDYAEGY